MSLPPKRARGMVLPSLILISIVLLILVTALLSAGTSSLRTTTYSQQSDVATYAAEAGLVEAVEQYRRDGSLPSSITGPVAGSGASYVVTKYENKTTGSMTVPGGPSIPPSTLYLLSEGVSSNGTRERAGALFRMSLGAFQAGVVSDELTAQEASFDAYDSSVDPNPLTSLQSNRGILASNRFDPALSAPQFSLSDTSVDGGVFVTPGTTPAQQIVKSGKTVVAREGTLAKPITVENIVLPVGTKGGKAEGGETTGGDFDPTTYSPSAWRLTEGSPSDLKVTWNKSSQRFVFKDDGGLFSTSTVGSVSIAELQAAQNARPPKLEFGDSDGRRVVFNFASNKLTYDDPKSGGIGGKRTSHADLPPIFTDALVPDSVETKNPDSIEAGAYSSVTIDDTTPTKLESGTYVIENLDIVGSGQLQLPADKSATIYVTGHLTAKGENAIVNSTRLPTNLKIYYTGDKLVELSGGSQAYLTLVAPKAEVKLEGLDPDRQSIFYGALVGKSVKVINAALHFDVATEGVGTGTDGSTLTLLNRHRL